MVVRETCSSMGSCGSFKLQGMNIFVSAGLLGRSAEQHTCMADLCVLLWPGCLGCLVLLDG